MNPPIIYILQPEAKTPASRDLYKRYASRFRIRQATSGAEALQQLAQLREENQQVALIFSTQTLPDTTGIEFFGHVGAVFAESRKVLLAQASDTESAITAINQRNIHYYLVEPWDPEKLAHLDTLLDDWRAAVQLPHLHVKGIMNTHIARIRADSNLHAAAEIVALSGVSDLMVVDASGAFVGVLSEGDILRAALPNIDEILAEGGTLESAYQIFLRRGAELANHPIEPLIIRQPITLQPEDHVAKAATILISKQIRLLPVVNKDGRLLGTVSRANICEAVVGTM